MFDNNEIKPIVGRCPSCDTRIRFQDRLQQFQLVRCPECGQTLEVKEESPLRLAWAMEEAPEESHYDYR